jgi:hypothetical protein
VDSSSVIIVLPFIALNNCLGTRGKIVFFIGSKCHLRIDQGQNCHSNL